MATRYPHGIASGTVTTIAAPAAITAATAPAGGTGATGGAYDTNTNRDLMIASLTATQVDVAALRTKVAAILTALKAIGLVPNSGAGTIAAPSAITASTAPAGGSGATAGAYDTASNRNLMLASLTATQVDVAALRGTVAAMLTAIQATGTVA
jgi:hypothetical protein